MEAKEAVKTAYDYLFKASPNSSKLDNFKLEEISTDSDGNFLLTLSYDLIGDYGFDKEKTYKDFKVLQNGTVEWMKIRTV